MRIMKLGTGLLLGAGLLLPAAASLAGGPTPPVLFNTFTLEDSSEGNNNCSTIIFDGEFFEVSGQVTGVSSNNDTVTVTYDQDFVDSVKAKSENGSIGQKSTGQVTLDIAVPLGSPTNPFNGTVNPLKCSIKGAVRKAGSEGRVKVSCELGENFSEFSVAPDAGQQTAFEEAFPKARKDVKVNGKKNKLTINQKGVTSTTCP